MQVEIMISKKLEVPLWRVIFTKDLKNFELQRLNEQEPPITLTEQEYIEFHKSKLRQLP
jgi:hypothetical protein